MLFGKYVNKFYSKYWYLFLLGALFLIIVDYFQLLIPEIYGKIVNELYDGTLFSENNKKILTYSLQILGVGAIMFIGRFGWRNTVFGVGIRIESDLRDELFSKVLTLDQSFFKQNKTGGLLSYFTNDLEVIQRCFGQGTILIVDAFFLGTLAYIKMLKLSARIALFALIPLLIILVGSFFIERFMKKCFLKKQEAYEALSDFANENFSGISTIKAFVREEDEKKRFNKINEQNKKSNLDFVKISIIVDVLFTFLLNAVVGILIYFCSDSVLKGASLLDKTKTFNVGNMTELISYFDTLIWPMFAISQLINLRAQGNASLKRVTNILDTVPEVVDKEEALTNEIKGDIRFNNLTFNYPDANIDVLKDVTFNIKAGEFVGIIGRTGAGKSTIVDILLRTYNIDKDMVYIDDIDIMDYSVKTLRGAIGYVPQDNFLFSDTISNNISFAYENSDLDSVVRAAKLSDVHDNITEFKDQYKTILGERGVTLSGGQKQRVAIARALIKDPQILILDDSVSAVDTKTCEEILTNLREIRKDKTTIIIGHRISTMKDLDKIVVLESGTVTGIGTHDELLKTNEEYKELVRLQTLEREVGDYNE